MIATSYYATGWPSRFHVVPPWAVEVDMVDGRRRYKIGREDVTGDMLHIRYQGSVDDAHGHGPLEAGRARLVAASALMRYATTLVAGGGIPSSDLEASGAAVAGAGPTVADGLGDGPAVEDG